MALISSSIPNLINGVSQQPPSLRLRSQAEEQINGLSSVAKGLLKRPPTQHLANLQLRGYLPLTSLKNNSFIHSMDRGDGEKYTLIIQDAGRYETSMFVVDSVTGFRYSIEYGSLYAAGYVSTENPAQDISATTVADYTFIVNRTYKTRMSSQVTPIRPHEGLVFIKTGEYACDYKVTVKAKDGSWSKSATYQTPPNTSTKTGTDGQAEVQQYQKDIRTNNIAQQLLLGLQYVEFSVERIGSSLYIKSDKDFTIEVEDSQGDRSMFAFKDSVTKLTDLPKETKVGFVIQVTGDVNKGQDDYFVEYKGNDQWKECAEPGTQYKFDPNNMPHQLVRKASDDRKSTDNPYGIYFSLEPVEWDEKTVGTEDSNPPPSFIGSTINDIFFHRNRLGFLSDENVIFSQSGEFFNFFRSTTLTMLDTAPIDIAVSNDKVSILQRAVPFNETLILFSDRTQFALKAEDILTPDTVQIDVTTQFECDLLAPPVGAGKNVFFAVNRGAYSGVREFFVDPNNATNDAADITAHVPEYIKGRIKLMAASSNEEMLLVVSENDPSTVYVYNYYWQGTEKVQQAWSKWTFDGIVQSATFDDSYIIMLIEREGAFTLERINLSQDDDTTPLVGFDVHLDQRAIVNQGESAPYTLTDDHLAVTSTGQIVTGTQAEILNPEWYIVGRPYNFEYTFSEQVITENQDTGSKVALSTARLQLRTFVVAYTDSGSFTATVQPRGRNEYVYKFDGRTIGSPMNTLDTYAIDSGAFKFPVMAKSTDVTIKVSSDDIRPCEFQSAEWEGFFHIRSRRM